MNYMNYMSSDGCLRSPQLSQSPRRPRRVCACVCGRLISTFLTSLELKAFDVKALRAFRVLRPLKLVSGVPSEYILQLQHPRNVRLAAPPYAPISRFFAPHCKKYIRTFTAVFWRAFLRVLTEPKYWVAWWRNCRMSDLRSRGRGFDHRSRRNCVTTLGKLFTPDSLRPVSYTHLTLPTILRV